MIYSKNKENNIYITLSEASKISGISRDYLNVLIRREKLRAVKIGKNWLTTKAWLSGCKMPNHTEQNQGSEYLSLFNAAKIANVSSGYLNVAVRRGKLQAVKLGRNWFTTSEWLGDYQKSVGREISAIAEFRSPTPQLRGGLQMQKSDFGELAKKEKYELRNLKSNLILEREKALEIKSLFPEIKISSRELKVEEKESIFEAARFESIERIKNQFKKNDVSNFEKVSRQYGISNALKHWSHFKFAAASGLAAITLTVSLGIASGLIKFPEIRIPEISKSDFTASIFSDVVKNFPNDLPMFSKWLAGSANKSLSLLKSKSPSELVIESLEYGKSKIAAPQESLIPINTLADAEALDAPFTSLVSETSPAPSYQGGEREEVFIGSGNFTLLENRLSSVEARINEQLALTNSELSLQKKTILGTLETLIGISKLVPSYPISTFVVQGQPATLTTYSVSPSVHTGFDRLAASYLSLSHNAEINGSLTVKSGGIFNTVSVSGNTTLTGDATIGGTLNVTGDTTLNNLTLNGTLSLPGAATLGNASSTYLTVSNTAWLNQLKVTGTATTTFNSPITSFSGNFIVAADSANNILLNPYGGNVGIGTSSPNNLLTIAGATTPSLGLTTNSGLSSWTVGIDTADANKFKIASSTAVGTSARLTIDGSGKVGIGTTSPGSLFSVNSTGNTYLGGDLTVSGTVTFQGSTSFDSGFNLSGIFTQTASSTSSIISSVASSTATHFSFDARGAGPIFNVLKNNSSKFYIDNLGNVGIATTTFPASFGFNVATSTFVYGNQFISGGLGVGLATTTSGAIQTSGDVFVGRNLYVSGNSTTLGASSADTLTINSSIKSNLIPDLNATRDLGSSAFYWDDAFIDTLTVNNLSAASSSVAGTQAETFTINSDNNSADSQNAEIIFYRGTVVPNALFTWNSATSSKRFEMNQVLYINNGSASTTNPSFTVKGIANQTADLLKLTDSSSNNLFTVSPYGAVNIATSTYLSNFGLNVATSTNIFGSLRVGTSTLTINSGNIINDNGQFNIVNTANSNLTFYTNNSERVRIDNSGNVGIGTTTPITTFAVNGNGYFGSALGVGILNTTANTFRVGQCVTGDTRLRRRRRKTKKNPHLISPLSRGSAEGVEDDEYIYDEVAIIDIKPGDEVLSLNEKTGELVYCRVKQLAYMGVKPIYKLTTASGKTIRTTGNHPYLVRTSSSINFISKFYTRYIKNFFLSKEFYPQFPYAKTMRRGTHISESFSKLHRVFGLKKIPQFLFNSFSQFFVKSFQFAFRSIYQSVFPAHNYAGYTLTRPALISLSAFSYSRFITFLYSLLNGQRSSSVSINFPSETDSYSLSGSFSNNFSSIRHTNSQNANKSKRNQAGLPSWLTPATALNLLGSLASLGTRREKYSTFPPAGTSDNDFEDFSVIQKYNTKVENYLSSARWTKVVNLREGMEISVAGGNNKSAWDKIISIEYLPEEEVYDVEIENTHNFVAGHYINKKTGQALTPEQEEIVSLQRNLEFGTWNLEYTKKLEKLAFGVFGNQKTAQSAAFGILDMIRATGLTPAYSISNQKNLSSIIEKISNRNILQALNSKLKVPELNFVEFGGIIAHNTAFIVDGSGNVGIASTSPSAVLSLNVSNATGVANALNITSATTSLLYVRSDGNVGIGTTTPITTFAVNGNGYFGSALGVGILNTTANTFRVGQCVTGDTKLRRRIGRRKKKDGSYEDIFEDARIDEIKAGDEILTLDDKSGQLKVSRVKKLAYMGKKPIIELTTALGRKIRTTGNHPYFVREASPELPLRKPKLGIFFDNANMFYAQKKAGWKIDVIKMKQALAKQFDVAFFNHYHAVPVEGDAARQATLDFMDRIGQEITFRVKPLKYIQTADGIKKKGDMDVEIALDVTEAIDELDMVLIVSGDSDLLPLRKYVIERGKKIAFVGFKLNTAWELAMGGKYAYLDGFRSELALGENKTPEPKLGVALVSLLYSQPPSLSSGGVWIKVSALKEEQEIAVVGNNGKPVWDKITQLNLLSEEDVYDIEIENTHNFVGNGIIAHNTAFIIDGSGNVGIGTTTPGQLLSVNGNGYFAGNLNVASSTTLLNASTTNLTVSASTFLANATTTGLSVNGGTLLNSLSFGAATGTSLTVTGGSSFAGGTFSGLVGIGETAPGSRLSVSGGGSFGAGYDTTAAPGNGLLVEGYLGVGSSSPMAVLSVNVSNATGTTAALNITSATSSLFYVRSDGFVGIGISSTSSKGFLTINTAPRTSVATSTANTGDPYAFNVVNATSSYFYIGADGRIGIGTTSPQNNLLAIQSGNVYFGGGFQVSGNSLLGNATTTGLSVNGGTLLNSLSFGAATGTSLTVTGGSSFAGSSFSGSVGIGTTAPGAKLHIVSLTEQLRLERDSSNLTSFTQDGNGDLTFATTRYVYMDNPTRIGSAGDLSIAQLAIGGTSAAGIESSIYLSQTVNPAVNRESHLISIAGAIQEFSSGNHDILTALNVSAPSITTGDATVTNAATVRIINAPSATVTGGNYALWVDDGVSRFDGNVGIGTTSPNNLLTISSATTPAVGFTTATGFGWTVGMDTADSNKFKIASSTAVGTNARLTIDGNGNVGIGMASPVAKLYVNAASIGTGGDEVNNDMVITGTNKAITANQGNLAIFSNDAVAADMGGTITLGSVYTGTSVAALAAIKSGKTNSVASDYSGYLAFGTRLTGGNVLERMRIDNNGNVGIASTSPSAVLSVNVSNATGVANAFNITSATSSLLYVRSDGNVGIGTTTPITTFAVNGNGYFGSALGVGILNTTANTFRVGQCVTGDTRLRRRRRKTKKNPHLISPLSRGSAEGVEDDEYIYDEVAIIDIKPGDEVLSLNEKTGELVYCRVKQLAYMGVKPIYKLTTASGKTIRTTGNHPYFVYSSDAAGQIRKVFESTIISLPLKSFGVLKTVNNFLRAGITVSLNAGSILIRTMPGKSFGGYARILAKSESWVKIIRFSRLAFAATSASDMVLGAEATLKPHSLSEAIIAPDIFSSQRILSGIFSGFDKFADIMKRRLNVFRRELRIVILADNLINRHSGFKQFQNKVNHNTSAFKAGLPVTDIGVDSDVFVDIDHNKNDYITAVFPESNTIPFKLGRGKWRKVAEIREGDYIAIRETAKKAAFESIISIEYLPEEEVYDIEIENTHNFVAGHYIDRRTGKALTEEQEEVVAMRQNLELGTWNLENSKKLALLAANNGINQKTAQSAAFGDSTEQGNPGIDVRNSSVANPQNLSSISVDNLRTLDLEGVEPSESGRQLQTSLPSRPKVKSAYQNIEKISNRNILQTLNSKLKVPELNFVEFGGIIAHNTAFIVDGAGNVGIGTTSPGQLLSVNGNGYFAGNLNVASSTTLLNASTTNLTVSASTFLGNATTTGLSVNGGTLLNSLSFGAATGTSLTVTGGSSFAGSSFSGSVGIGTTDFQPISTELLQVGSTLTSAHTLTGTRMIITTPDAAVENQGNFAVLTSDSQAADLGGSIGLGGMFESARTVSFGKISGRKENSTLNNASGYLQFATMINGGNPTERMRITSSGLVGVGTTTPNNLLTIAGNTTPSLNFKTNNTDSGWAIGVDTADANKFKIASSTAVGTNARLTIDGNGNVGIASTSPSAVLSLNVSNATGDTAALNITSATTSLLYVRSDGSVGVGTTTPGLGVNKFKFVVQGNASFAGCVGFNAASNSGTCVDVAESYPTSEPMEAGDIVQIKQFSISNSQFSIERATSTSKNIIGIISTNPGILLNGYDTVFGGASQSSDSSTAPVALAGRVPVKVSLENGPIMIGDRITVSSISGVGMRATATSTTSTVGIALELFDETIFNSQFSNIENCNIGNSLEIENCKLKIGKILVFVNLGQPQLAAKQGTGELADMVTAKSDLNMNGFALINVKSISGLNNLWKIDENGNIIAQSVETQRLTVGGGAASGVTIYDRTTATPKCIYIEEGVVKTSDGACGATQPSPEVSPPTSASTTVVEGTLTSDVIPGVATTTPVLEPVIATSTEPILTATTTPEIITTSIETATSTP